MSDSSNDSGNLSLFFSVSSIDTEESKVPEVEGDLETVEPYQFESVASDSSTESDTEAEDTDSGVEDRLRSRDWTQTSSQLESSDSSLSMEETEQNRLRWPESLLLSLIVVDCSLFNA